MAGFGTGPYGLFSLGLATPTPYELAPAKVGSAVKIDAVKRRYVVADDGGFEAMDETAQRVLLLVSLAFRKESPFITPTGNAEIALKIRTALAPLTSTRDPDIELDEPQITSVKDTSNRLVRYKNLRTGTFQYVATR